MARTRLSPIDATRALLPEAAERIADEVDRVLADPLFWYPVRHHSPAVARHLAATIRERKPKLLFVEAPHEATHLVAHLVAKDTRPPVAIYSSFRDDHDRLGLPRPHPDVPVQLPCWYPLTAYSPEYVALREATKLGAEVVFLDLPHWALPRPAEVETARADLDVLVPRSELYARLSHAAGHRSWDETWDTLFELSSPEPETFRRELLTFCAAVRASTDPAEMIREGNLARERFMWATIEAHLVDPADAMVVCGGFHVFLERGGDPPPVPEGTVRTTLVPYSWPRLSAQSGYAAGNRAPRYYRLLHDLRDPEELLLTHVVDVLARARRKGERLSAADAIAVVHHAHLLAQLRGRTTPTLDDLRDALVTCCCKGDPETEAVALLEALQDANVGTRIGAVTSGVGRLPIVVDFHDSLERHELEDVARDEATRRTKLDLRDPDDAARSAFLHRLRYLDVPFGTVSRDGDPFGQSIFREHWSLRWTPKTEPALIERSLDGDTVEAAAISRLRRQLAASATEAGATCRELLRATEMSLPGMLLQLEEICGHAVDVDGRFVSLADALRSLLLLERHAAYRELPTDSVLALATRAFERACFAIPEIAAAPEEDQPAVVRGLRVLAEAVLQRDELRVDHFRQHLELAADAAPRPYLRGIFLGLLVEIRQLEVDVVARELTAAAQGSVEVQLAAGDFLAGVLAVSRVVLMLGTESIVAALDGVLREVAPETFLQMVPRLRAAFDAAPRRQRTRLAAEVARRYGLAEGSVRETLAVRPEVAALIAELDAEAEAILVRWGIS